VKSMRVSETFRKAFAYSVAVHIKDGVWRRIKNSLRWAFLASFRSDFSTELFAWAEQPEIQPFVKVNPIVALRPLRPYVSIGWDRDRRFKVISDTYSFILLHSGAMRQALLSPEGTILARLELARLGRIEIRLGKDIAFRKEGELVLSVQSQDLDGWRMSMAFSLEAIANSQWICYIGCVQGRGGIDAMRETTRAMHGLRPRSLMVFVAQEVARTLGVKEILGVSNAIQTFHRKHLIHLPFRHTISFDYDVFWLECGAVLDAEGWFHLPVQTARRTREEIKPNKRSLYVKRYAMLDDLSTQIGAGLQYVPIHRL